MSSTVDLAQAVLLLQGAHKGFRTAVGTVSLWANGGVAEAIRRSRPDLGDQSRTPEGPDRWGSPDPQFDDFWAETPSRFRLERKNPIPPRFPRLAIANGLDWWTYDPVSGAESNHGVPTAAHLWLGAAPDLLDPAEVLGCLDLGGGAPGGEVSGRPAIHLEGRERQSLRRPGGSARLTAHMLLTPYADRYDLWFDAETGVCLRAVSMLDDHPIKVVELVRIEFNRAIPSTTFTFVAPDGVEVRTAPSRSERASVCATKTSS